MRTPRVPPGVPIMEYPRVPPEYPRRTPGVPPEYPLRTQYPPIRHPWSADGVPLECSCVVRAPLLGSLTERLLYLSTLC